MCCADQLRIVVVRGGNCLDFVVVQPPDHLDGKGLSRRESFGADQGNAIRKVVDGWIELDWIGAHPSTARRRSAPE